MKLLSELICSARNISPPKGELSGQCIFCGRYSEEGHPAKMSPEFTNAPQLSGGEVICPFCYHMQTAEIPGAKQSAGKLYRANMWLASIEGMAVIRFPKKENAKTTPRDLSEIFTLGEVTPRAAVTTPPEPPFAIYLTRTWKKSGWQPLIRANGGVATSRDSFVCGFDYDPVHVNRHQLCIFLEDIDALREQKLSKTEIASGKVGIRSLDRIGYDQNIVRLLKLRATDPLWSLAVYVA